MKEFLQNYLDLETILRDRYGKQVKDYEEELDENTKNKLRLCRSIRNYLSHNKDGKNFVAVTSEMSSFLGKLSEELDGDYKPVSKKMVKIDGCLTLKSKVSDAVSMLKKSTTFNTGKIPVFDGGNVVGLFSSDYLAKMISKGDYPKATSKISSSYLEKYKKNIARKDWKIKDLPSGVYVVEESGKIVGYIN